MHRAILSVALSAVVSFALFGSAGATVPEADQLRLRGRYEEAVEQYQQVARAKPVDAALGIAHCRAAVGETSEATRVLTEAVANHPDHAALHAELARLAFERGDWRAAERAVHSALERDAQHALARWVGAELARVQGKLADARAGYRWFAERYAKTAELSDEELLWHGKAIAQHARFERDSGWFRRLVNELYPRALEQNALFWPARVESARLFLEKYNEPEAARDLNAALAINPRAAEAHALRARLALQNFDLAKARQAVRQALAIHPLLLEAHHREADVLLAELKIADAGTALEKARVLNPLAEETLGRLAAVYRAIDGPNAAADDRLTSLIDEVVARNPHCGRFFQTAGKSFELMRRFPQAADNYRQALERMPELIDVRGQLGLTLMRLGDEARAAKLLDESFAMDPFNVRVKNMLEVLDVLQGYAVLETDHFVLKFDRGLDDLLAAEMAEYLEQVVYPEVTERLGFAPSDKTLIEIFNRAKNTDGHGWFSARMVGLPFIGTVGACAGKVVALASPSGMRQPYNWARVIKHEFVHVVNLQQTDFNIPHWYTEGLAVWHEDMPRPTEWTEILARRAKANRLFDLDSINFGFIRPGNSEDWTLAYCQSELYVEFMRDTFGDDGPARLLAAYGEQLDTAQAIRRAFEIEQAEFERRYREYLDELIESSPVSPAVARSANELQAAIRADPDDSAALAELAYVEWQRGNTAKARELALRARGANAADALAAYVLARVYLSIGDVKTALPLLQTALDPESPQPNVLALLAAIRVKAQQWDEAERLYEIGAKAFPSDDRWPKGLARVYLETSNQEKLPGVLEQLAELDYDNVAIRKKLAQLALESEDFEAASRWSNQVLHINVMDADAHALLARSWVARDEHREAATRYERALRVRPDQTDWRLALAESYIKTKRLEDGRRELLEVLRQRPDDRRAKELLESLSSE